MLIPDIVATRPLERFSLKTRKPLKPIEFVWWPCPSCREFTAMPLKRDGTIGGRGSAWSYGKCPFCGKARRP